MVNPISTAMEILIDNFEEDPQYVFNLSMAQDQMITFSGGMQMRNDL